MDPARKDGDGVRYDERVGTDEPRVYPAGVCGRSAGGNRTVQIRRVLCLFEQSGTFKNEFKKLGIPAEDYDILNDFGETDHVIDLFGEIDKAYDGEPSLFDEIGEADLVFAFFPCTRFEAKIPLAFRGQRPNEKNWTDEQKLEQSMKLHEELHGLYMRICKLFSICLRGGVEPDC